jgi:hypothetical protein
LTNEKVELSYLLIVSHGAVGVSNVAKCPAHAGPVTQLPADVQVRLEGVNLNFFRYRFLLSVGAQDFYEISLYGITAMVA